MIQKVIDIKLSLVSPEFMEFIGINFVLSVILTIFGYVLGLAHAIWVCDGMKFEGDDDDFTPFGFLWKEDNHNNLA